MYLFYTVYCSLSLPLLRPLPPSPSLSPPPSLSLSLSLPLFLSDNRLYVMWYAIVVNEGANTMDIGRT